MDEGLLVGESFGVDASLVPANANKTRGIESKEGLPADLTSRAVDECIEALNDAAFGASTKAVSKYISPVDPAARWTGADGGAAYFAYSTIYLVDLDNAVGSLQTPCSHILDTRDLDETHSGHKLIGIRRLRWGNFRTSERWLGTHPG